MGKAAAIFVILALCLVATLLTDRPAPRAELTWIEPQDIHTLDPQRMSYTQDFRAAYALYEGLLRWDVYSEDFRVVPAGATRWELSDDRLRYTFHLEPRARWSSGDPVRASDYVYAWKRALLPDTAADYSKLFFCIDGAEEFFEWRVKQLAAYTKRPLDQRGVEQARELRREADEHFDRVVGVRALDDFTLEITLKRPTPFFLDLCAFGPFMPVHPPTVEAWVSVDPTSGAIKQRHGWTKPGVHVGNGPYRLKTWRFKRDMTLLKCPSFHDQTLARAASIKMITIEDQNTSLLAFQSGAADWHTDLDVSYVGDMIEQNRRGERDDLHSIGAFGTYFWSFNCTPTFSDGRANPFADARVRRAFALCIDKQSIVRKIRRSEEAVAHTLIPPDSIAGFRTPKGLGLDPARAREELAAAGWLDRDGDGVPEDQQGVRFPLVELLCTPTGPHRDVALAMSRMWEEALGIQSKVVVRETKVYRNTLKRRDYMLARGIWYGDYLDPLTFLDLHRTDDGNNDRGFSDAHYDALLARADNTLDTGERMRVLEEAERYTMEEAIPVMPLWHFDHYYLYKPSEKDGAPNPGGLRGISTHRRVVQYPFLLEVVRDARAGSAARHSVGAEPRAAAEQAP